MPLSWNEIKSRVLGFSREWQAETSEDAEAKSFWDGFFSIFGISRKRIASFEEPVIKLGDKQGYIDLFWKGVLLVEHKSRGRNLDNAYTQALDKAVDGAYGKPLSRPKPSARPSSSSATSSSRPCFLQAARAEKHGGSKE